jgi:MFS-type transporter involved in bile tolerance (Atg22 family)
VANFNEMSHLRFQKNLVGVIFFIGATPLCLTAQDVVYYVKTQHIHTVHQYTKGDMFRFLTL